MVRCLSTMWETWVQSLGLKDPLEKEMATHSSTLAWKIPWTEELGRLQIEKAHAQQIKTQHSKRKKRDKRGREGFPSREDSLKKRKFSKHQESFSLPNLCQALEAQRAT